MLFNRFFKRERNHSKLSFSQCGEDLIVKFIFDSLKIYKPSYLDIGAHHPFHINNTNLFYRNGSRGINIEPNPILISKFKRFRPLDINLNIGISNKEETLDFYILNASSLNTFSIEEAKKYEKQGNYFIKDIQKIKVNTIENILRENNVSTFPNYLTIDAEGIDEIVLKTIDFENNFPIVICVETITFSNSGQGVKNNKIITFLESKGYMLYADTYINSIFVNTQLWKRNIF